MSDHYFRLYKKYKRKYLRELKAGAMVVIDAVEEKKTKSAVYGGAFDPPTKAHLDIAQMLLTRYKKVYMIPTGHRPDKPNISPYIDRFRMCRDAVQKRADVYEEVDEKEGVVTDTNTGDNVLPAIKDEDDYSKIIVSPLEFIAQPNEALSSYEVMTLMEASHPNEQFEYIIGSDILNNIYQWDGDKLVDSFDFGVIQREGDDNKIVYFNDDGKVTHDPAEGRTIVIPKTRKGTDYRPVPRFKYIGLEVTTDISSSRFRSNLRDCTESIERNGKIVDESVKDYIKGSQLKLYDCEFRTHSDE